MKLHAKLVLSLLTVVIIVVLFAQTWLYSKISDLVEDQSGENIRLIESREAEFAHNIHRLVENAVAGSLERGEMEKFDKLLRAQRNIKGLLEFSLYDRNGIVTNSSNDSSLNKQLSSDIKKSLKNNSKMQTITTDETIEIYETQIANTDCIRCHTTWKVGEIGGTTYFSFSANAIKTASEQTHETLEDMKKTIFMNSLLTVAIIVPLLIAAMYILVKLLVVKPVDMVIDFARKVSKGHLSETLNISRKDEIGLLVSAINKMVMELGNVLKEMDELVHAIQEGRLDARADAEAFEGGWQGLVLGVNNLISTLAGHIDNIPVPSMIIDKDFTIRYMSKAGAELIGMNREHLIGQKCGNYFRTSDCGTADCACDRAMRTGRNEKRETDARPGGRELHISYTGVPMKNQEGEITGAMEVIIDQTAIRKAMDSAGETAGVLLDSVRDITVSSQQVSGTSNEQAAAVKEIVSTMEDSDRLARSIAAKINGVTEIANTTKNVVAHGFSIIKQSFAKMDQIKNSNSETIAEIKSLGDRIESIWEIVNMINGIADQTRIIAFNAELEASSAGDAGKNFQIVATEIRRLADSTVSSTGEIRSKISEIQNSSDKLIIASEDGTEKIAEGWKLSDKLNKVFEEILSSSELSAQSADQIALSINQQVSAFEQILLTLKQISEGIDSFVVSTRATTHASEKLREMADSLHVVIEECAGSKKTELIS
ncbi:MAG: PAS domain-containing protein [Desulfobacterales bacterium]|nr:PAS domain-containing protein [Desulfobacterales bacterium]